MEESRTKKSVKNIIFNLSNQVIGIILNFVSRTIFIHTLGVEYLGLNGIFSDVLSMLSMADLGFNTAMVYSFYKPIAENNQRKISALINFYSKVYNIIALIITILGILIIPFLPLIINLEKDIPLLNVYYLFSLANVVISYLFVYKTSIITADQKNYIVTKITIITTTIRTVLQIITLLLFKNYIIYLSLGIIGNLLSNYIASEKAERLYPYIKNKEDISKEEKLDIFNNLKSVFLYKASSVLLNATDNTIISVLLGTVIVGYYSNYLMINNKIVSIFSLVFTSLTASIGNIIVTESTKKRFEIFKCEQSISFIICTIVIPCFFNLINDLILIWLGKDFVFDLKVIFAISLNMYLSCVLQPLWSYREATGLYRKTKWIMLICAILNIILSILMGKLIGLMGILLASAISRICTYVWIEPKILFKEYFEESPNKYFCSLVKNLLIIGVFSISLNLIFKNWIISSWIGFILKSIVLIIISIIISCVIYAKNPSLSIIKNKIIKYK